jgi:hypothetical protein
MKKTSVIILVVFLITAGRALGEPQLGLSPEDTTIPPEGSYPFIDCGILVQGMYSWCVLFQADSGGEYLLDTVTLGGFIYGERVQVSGYLEPGCYSVCMEGDGCIIDATISPCTEPYWPPSAAIVPQHPTSSDKVAITLSGEWPGCEGPQDALIRVQGNKIYFDVLPPPGPQICPAFVPWEITKSVGPLAPGTYAVYACVYWVPWEPWNDESPRYTYLTEFTVIGAAVSWIHGTSSPPAWTIEPQIPTSSDAVNFSGPTPIFGNPCEAAVAMGEPKLAIDPVNKTVRLEFQPLPPGVVCPEYFDPVCGLEGFFGPLAEGQWLFSCSHPFATFSVAFEVTRAPRVYYIDAVNGSNDNDGLSPETAFATIQKGVDSAKDGDTILVYPAVYSEAIDFKGRAITLQGIATAAGIAVIEAPGEFAVSFYTGEGPDSVLRNFVIRDSNMAVFVSEASPTINHLTVVDNVFGIGAYESSQPDISNCIFWNNADGDLFQCEARFSCVHRDIGRIESLIAHLVGWWKFDGNANDESDYLNHGIVHGAGLTTGFSGQAYQFNTRSKTDEDYINIPFSKGDELDFSNKPEVTTSFWLNLDEIPSDNDGGARPMYWEDSVSLDGDESIQWFARDNGDGTYRLSWGIRNQAGQGAPTVCENIRYEQWHTFTGTYGNDYKNVYMDGDLRTSAYLTGNIHSTLSGDDWIIGDATPDKKRGIVGKMDEVCIFDKALSAEEVRLIYLAVLDPLFADANGGDYHLLSERGRYWPEHDVWVLDNVTSPCVDGGDPMLKPSNEPMPNGGRVNMGAYGDTPYASMSEWPIREDNNRDGIVNVIDFAMLADKWLETTGWVNQPPQIYITSPPDGFTFLWLTETVILAANARDDDGSVVKVQFFANGQKWGGEARYEGDNRWVYLTSFDVGTYVLTAQATDDDGATTMSPPITITAVEQ